MKVILEVTARKHKIDLLAKSSRLSKKTLLYRFCDSVKLTASLLVLFQFLFVQRNRKSLLVFNFLSDEVKFGARMAEMLKSPVKRKGQYGRP